MPLAWLLASEVLRGGQSPRGDEGLPDPRVGVIARVLHREFVGEDETCAVCEDRARKIVEALNAAKR